MLECKDHTFYLDNEPLTPKQTLFHMIDSLSESAGGTPIPHKELLSLSEMVEILQPMLTVMDSATLLRAQNESIHGLECGSHAFSGHILARILFYLAEVLRLREEPEGIDTMVYFCSDTLFSFYLHKEEYYRYIAYSFYDICGTHAATENKGYFNVVKYIEKKRGYNGMEIDFLHMASYYIKSGIASKKTDLIIHEHYKGLIYLYETYRKLTDGICGRYEKINSAKSLYSICMRRIRIPGNAQKQYIWPGMAYLLALYLGHFRKRLRVASLYRAESLCKPTDLDVEIRKLTLKKAFRIIAPIILVGTAIYQLYLYFTKYPVDFYIVAFFGVIAIVMGANYWAAGGSSSPHGYISVYNPWSGNGWQDWYY